MKTQTLFFSLALILSVHLGFAQSWNQVTVPTQNKLNDIQFIDNQIGFIVGDSATILKTDDGGVSWTVQVPQGIFPSQNIIDIDMVDAMNGFAVCQYGPGVLKTSDGGVNWDFVPNNTTNQCFPASVYASSSSNLFVGGSDCFQGATINRVLFSTWTNQTVNFETFDTDHYVTEIDFDGSLGLAAVNNEYMLRSTDAGVTWDSINTNIGAGNVLTSVMIGSNDTCYAGYNQNGGGFGILYSADNGLTWQEDINSATFYYPVYNGFTESNDGTIYNASVPSNSNIGVIFETVAGSWTFESVAQPVYAMDSYGDDVTWAVGDSGFVVVNKDLTLSVETVEQNESLLIYPNPTSDAIHWQCDDCGVRNVRIIDITGKIVVEENQILTKEIDLTAIPTGIYIMEMETSKSVIRKSFVKE